MRLGCEGNPMETDKNAEVLALYSAMKTEDKIALIVFLQNIITGEEGCRCEETAQIQQPLSIVQGKA